MHTDNPRMALDIGFRQVKPIGNEIIAYIMNENGDVWRYSIYRTSKGPTILDKKSGLSLIPIDQRAEIYLGARRVHNEF